MKNLENILYISILGLLGLLGIWLQAEILHEKPEKQDFSNRHDPDYYIENFTAIGMDETGERKYVLEAERLAHFPDDDTALLDNPHVIEFRKGFAPRHTYAESGWMNSTGDEILLTGNVRIVFEADSRGPGGTMKSKRMRIFLEKGSDAKKLF